MVRLIFNLTLAPERNCRRGGSTFNNFKWPKRFYSWLVCWAFCIIFQRVITQTCCTFCFLLILHKLDRVSCKLITKNKSSLTCGCITMNFRISYHGFYNLNNLRVNAKRVYGSIYSEIFIMDFDRTFSHFKNESECWFCKNTSFVSLQYNKEDEKQDFVANYSIVSGTHTKELY